MNFGIITRQPCTNTPAPTDARCDDQAFALANPTACAALPRLIIKPDIGLVCLFGSVQMKTFLVDTSGETDVTDQTVFSSSNPDIIVVGAISGNANATGVSGGTANINASYGGFQNSAEVTVLANSNCCDSQKVAMIVLVDTSKSMSQNFNGAYSTKLVYAKAAATRFINEVNSTKDVIGLIQFNDNASDLLSAPIASKNVVSTYANAIVQTEQSTSFFDALTLAVSTLNATTADRKVIILISDGQDQTPSYLIENPISVAESFRAQGGIIMSLGVRASGSGFSLLSLLSTGGFFLNAYNSTATTALDFLSGLKGYVCAGNCSPIGDVYQPSPALAFTNLTNWDVISGTVDLVGPGLFDVLPGNGLYLAMDSTTAEIKSKTTFSFTSGKTYRIRLNLAGNQKISVGAKVKITIGSLFSTEIVLSDYAQNFLNYSFNFTPSASATAQVTILTNILSASIEWGPLIDSISLSNVTDIITMLDDSFDGENSTYIPPRCGLGTILVPIGTTNEVINYTSPWYCGDGQPSMTAVPISIGTLVAGGNYTVKVIVSNPHFDFEFPPGRSIGMDGYYNRGSGMERLLDGIVGFFDNQGPTLEFVQYITDPIPGSDFQVAVGINDPGSEIHPGCPGDGTGLQEPYPLRFQVIVSNETAGIGYGYLFGYNCYGVGCLTEPPPVQRPDPNALPDLEAGFTPPTVYNSTKTACVSCPVGTLNVGGVSLIPPMTSATAPSGEASASSEFSTFSAWKAMATAAQGVAWISSPAVLSSVPQWLQYEFASAVNATVYSINVLGYGTSVNTSNLIVSNIKPLNWILQGSQDGAAWTTLDTQLNKYAFTNTNRFLFNNSVAYKFYRIYFTAVNGNTLAVDGEIVLAGLALYSPAVAQVCISQSANSTISQADADAKALDAATTAAQSQLNCVTSYTSTETYTATCPDFTFGNPVSKTSTAVSLISQADADASALASAKVLATDALDCSGSNNEHTITIPAIGPASPYPSIKSVTGMTGLITKVTVAIKKLSHTFPDDLYFALRSPSGTMVLLMANCGGSNGITNVDLVFDDAAGSSLPNSTIITSGTYKPTGFSPYTVLPSPAPNPVSAYETTLASLIGEDPNGSWDVFTYDDSAGNAGQVLLGWDLTITTA